LEAWNPADLRAPRTALSGLRSRPARPHDSQRAGAPSGSFSTTQRAGISFGAVALFNVEPFGLDIDPFQAQPGTGTFDAGIAIAMSGDGRRAEINRGGWHRPAPAIPRKRGRS